MSQLAILVDGDNVSVHNISTGMSSTIAASGPATPAAPTAPEVTSALDAMFRQQTGKPIPPAADDPNAWWNKPQTGEPTARETLGPGDHPIPGGQVRRIIELSGPGAYAFHITTEKAGPLRLQLAGKTSGEVTGGIALVVPGVPDKLMEGPLQAFDEITRPLAIGEVVTMNLRYDAGDAVALLVVNPQS